VARQYSPCHMPGVHVCEVEQPVRVRRAKEAGTDSDVTPYLKVAGSVDLGYYHESWWDL
jgi:hypothetical protein